MKVVRCEPIREVTAEQITKDTNGFRLHRNGVTGELNWWERRVLYTDRTEPIEITLGDWIINKPDGHRTVVSDEEFNRMYRPLLDVETTKRQPHISPELLELTDEESVNPGDRFEFRIGDFQGVATLISFDPNLVNEHKIARMSIPLGAAGTLVFHIRAELLGRPL